jgi:hypothetical protein
MSDPLIRLFFMDKKEILNQLTLFKEDFSTLNRTELKIFILNEVLPLIGWELPQLKQWLKRRYGVITLEKYHTDLIWLLCHDLKNLIIFGENHV